ncbi:MAG: hypothetical protein ACXVDN_22265 [Ktedonobacteraceae bacterium]
MTLLKRSPLTAFFVLAYLIAWSIYVIQSGLFPFQLPEPISDLLVNWAPGFAAIIVVAAVGGLVGIRALLRPLLAWRVSLQWYTVAIFLPPLLVFAAIGITVLFGGPAPQFSQMFSPHLALLPILLFFNMGEEIVTLLQVGVAILVVVNYGPAHLSRQPKKTATVIINAEREGVL